MPTADAGSARARSPGIRIVDLSTVLAGPYATMILADLGADVVKVEPPEGDATRAGARRGSARSTRGRGPRPTSWRSIATSARSGSTSRRPRGVDILRRLLGDADVLVENLRPGTLARLGFDDATLAAIDPDLIHLAISRLRPRRPGGRPARLRLRHPGGRRADVDHRRRRCGRRPPDQGRCRDQRCRDRAVRGDRDPGRRCSARDGGLASGSTSRSWPRPWPCSSTRPRTRSSTGRLARPSRERAPEHRPVRDVRDTRTGSSPSPSGRSASGRGCAPRSGSTALAADPRFATNGDRVEHRDELRPILAERLASRPTADWVAAPRRGRGPVRRDRRHRRRVRLPGGGAPAGCAPRSSTRCSGRWPGRHPDRVRRHAGHDPSRRRRSSARTRTRSSARSAWRRAEVADLRARGVV